MTTKGDQLRSGEVDYTLDDLRQLARKISPTIWNVVGIFGWILLIGSVVTFVLSRSMNTPYELSDFLPAVGVAIVLAALGSATGRALTWRLRLRRNRLYAPQTFVISDSAFQILSSTGELTLPWTSILSIKRANERLFLFITRYSAYIVPRRAFETEEEFANFAAAAAERWKSSHAH